jgi:hypothetical protein
VLEREAELANGAADDARCEPTAVGHVTEARFDPYRGITGVVEFDDVAIDDGPFCWAGAVHAGERVSGAFGRLHRTGHADVLRLSYVVNADMHETTGPDGLPCMRFDEITHVQFVDVVMFAATDAHLIQPIN